MKNTIVCWLMTTTNCWAIVLTMHWPLEQWLGVSHQQHMPRLQPTTIAFLKNCKKIFMQTRNNCDINTIHSKTTPTRRTVTGLHQLVPPNTGVCWHCVEPNIGQRNWVSRDATTQGCSIHCHIKRTRECYGGLLWTWSTAFQIKMPKS